MRIARSLRLSARQLLAHRLRTVLALIGIIIGVAAVVVAVAVGNGAQRRVLSQIEAMGTDLLVVNAGEVTKMSGRRQVRGTVTTLTPQDAEAVGMECPAVKAIAPGQSRKLQVKYGNLTTSTTVVGTLPDYQVVRNVHPRHGSFFTDDDNRTTRRVAVIGQTVARNLFAGQDPIGATIRIGKVPFQVIGVLASKGADLAGADQDDQILIPIRTALRRLFDLTYINTVYVQAKSQERIPAATAQIRSLLRERHHLDRRDRPDDFTIQSQTELLATQRMTSGTFTTLIGSIAGVSLLIGGIGILAVMLIAVRERKREIGLRMAVGARRRDILAQFVIEASLVSAGGAVAGAVLGTVVALLLSLATSWELLISPASILYSVGFALAVGLFFGVYPARRASRLDPSEALRSE
jgi:putative ABC transport system permease protein